MLVWDPVSERNLPFGTLKTAALGKWNVTVPPISKIQQFIIQISQRKSITLVLVVRPVVHSSLDSN